MSSANRRILVVDDLDDDIELVILDVHLPTYDGVEVLMLLRGRQLSRPMKVLALTADVRDEVRDAMVEAGADGFLTKPVDLDLLQLEVERLMPGESQGEGDLHRRVRERGVTPPSSADPRLTLRRQVG